MKSNNSNLIPNENRTPEERRENAIKAGRASGEARRQKRLLRDCLESILKSPVPNEEIQERLEQNGVSNSYDNAIGLALIQKAASGDAKAFEVVRDTIGQKPADKMELASPAPIKIEVDYGDQNE